MIRKISKAYYDTETDTIHNCVPFSYVWFHEKRHQLQYRKLKWLKTFDNYYPQILYGGSLTAFCLNLFIFYIDWSILLSIIGIMYMFVVLSEVILELDATIFGTINWIKHTWRKRSDAR